MFGEDSLSGCGLEQSMAGAACSSEQDGSDSSGSRRGSVLLSRPSYEAQARSCSSWDGLPVCGSVFHIIIAIMLFPKLLSLPKGIVICQSRIAFLRTCLCQHHNCDLNA